MNNLFFNYNIFNIQDAEEVKIFGSGNKKMLVLVQTEEFKDEQQLSFLGKILKAAQYDLNDDVYCLPLSAETNISLAYFLRKYQIEHVLIFGLSLQKMGIYAAFRKYVFTNLQGVKILYADDLTLLQQQVQLKAALWEALKNNLLPNE